MNTPEQTTNPTPVQNLYREQGQSPWLDTIRRNLITSGELLRLIDRGIRGITANPSIFEKAITGSAEYDAPLREMAHADVSPAQIYEALAVEDIQMAADVFRPLYEQSEGGDGWVSIEVSPRLANDTQGTIEEARRLHRAVDRPNAFVKVPATDAGMPAIRQLLAEGININITLMFSVDVYDQVVEAYLDALEQRVTAGQPVAQLASVASFFVSRVDTEVDLRLGRLIAAEQNEEHRRKLQWLLGRAAVANARIAYDHFQKAFQSDRFARLQAQGARLQRPLWASTGTKNPAYSDVKYVEELIGPATVNTMPLATVDAFEELGRVARTIDLDPASAYATIAELEAAGISMSSVTGTLLTDGIRQFAAAFDRLESAIDRKRESMLAESRVG